MIDHTYTAGAKGKRWRIKSWEWDPLLSVIAPDIRYRLVKGALALSPPWHRASDPLIYISPTQSVTVSTPYLGPDEQFRVFSKICLRLVGICIPAR
jgi:hypothetical protein